jgi:hypothetical protein
MRFVAAYDKNSGKINTLVTVPNDPSAPVPGFQVGPGEDIAEFSDDAEMSEQEMQGDALRDHMARVVEKYRISAKKEVTLHQEN